MKLSWLERSLVNNPFRVLVQRLELRWLRGRLPLPPGALVLEVGCGRGAGARLLAREFQPRALYALDLDEDMIRRAAAYRPRRGQVSFLVGDVLNLPFREAVLEAVFSFGVLHHVAAWEAALAEISRVLKTGGYLFLEEYYPQVYQNFLAQRLLLHPQTPMFRSRDLKNRLKQVKMPLKGALELTHLGLLGVAVKEG
jgi:ubiquinone/menaquinone biosynthesis C-methylase UbiE